MISPADITPDFVDISTLWCRTTGERTAVVTAHMRGGAVCAVRVRRPGQNNPEDMCRNGAAARLSADVMAMIEGKAQGRLQ